MRAVVQKVSRAKVSVDGQTIGQIEKGFLVLLGVYKEDTDKDLDYIYKKVTGLRVFEDENDQMNLALNDVGGELLVVSQFTLYGDARKGRRPSFTDAAKGDLAKSLYEDFITRAKADGFNCKSGEFGAHMEVELVNDGPVTILLDSFKNF
ncbi:D-aminoacyl-tRNA deacylase [Neofamilia massiliensis]|uniref:D-aminoacyl-tRNA deacylase n=1 Tax=Neofamilia massiliensis TaxID=1673724 RepID=UPI0006BB6EE9|nr:D-aminoacyl-tRNA deacylase [Neofamilia massiliensis]